MEKQIEIKAGTFKKRWDNRKLQVSKTHQFQSNVRASLVVCGRTYQSLLLVAGFGSDDGFYCAL